MERNGTTAHHLLASRTGKRQVCRSAQRVVFRRPTMPMISHSGLSFPNHFSLQWRCYLVAAAGVAAAEAPSRDDEMGPGSQGGVGCQQGPEASCWKVGEGQGAAVLRSAIRYAAQECSPGRVSYAAAVSRAAYILLAVLVHTMTVILCGIATVQLSMEVHALIATHAGGLAAPRRAGSEPPWGHAPCSLLWPGSQGAAGAGALTCSTAGQLSS
jgi:hypothetical protein